MANFGVKRFYFLLQRYSNILMIYFMSKIVQKQKLLKYIWHNEKQISKFL